MSVVKKFFSILKIELEDTEEDIKALLSVYEHRRDAGEISNYVYQNNASVFRKELSSIAEIVRELDGDSQEAPGTLSEAETFLLDRIRQSSKDFDFPQAVLEICTRKIQKVKQFVKA